MRPLQALGIESLILAPHIVATPVAAAKFVRAVLQGFDI
jgi:hypothetical protein